MLVLKRKEGQGVLIGDDIEVNIVKLEDGSVKISIQAPKNISIVRTELLAQVQKENANALNSDLNILKKLK